MPTPQTNDRPDRIPEPRPENARQAVAMVRDDHQWKPDVLDLNSTDGIKRNIEALWSAVHRLAGYIDGERPATDGVKPASSERPVDLGRQHTPTQPAPPPL